MKQEKLDEFDQLGEDYQDLKAQYLAKNPDLVTAVKKVKRLFSELEKRPDGSLYMSLPISLLLDYEFQLARMNEYLGAKAAEVEGSYTYYNDKYKQKYLIDYRAHKTELNLGRDKVTVADIDSVTTEGLAEFQDKVNVLYEYSRYLKSLVESTNQYLVVLTHRIKNEQSERPFSRER